MSIFRVTPKREQRQSARHHLDNVTIEIDGKDYPVRNISLTGVMFGNSLPVKVPPDEVTITQLSCTRNMIKGVKCRHDASRGLVPVKVPFYDQLRYVRSGDKGRVAYSFRKFDDRNFAKMSHCATCSLRNLTTLRANYLNSILGFLRNLLKQP